MAFNQDRASMEAHQPVKTILIVEDDTSIGMLLQWVIMQETHHVALVVTTSDRALEVVQHVKPNLFLLDHHLEKVNAIDLYDLLHATDGLENVPAIIATAANLEQYQAAIEERHLIGMSKPFELGTLLKTIETLLNEHLMEP